MENKKITIFTPTYNRGNCLKHLYKSLKSQTNCEFEWVIVDDGSNDGTEILVQNFINDNIISIKYNYVNNGGKYKAINIGLDIAEGELFFIVDSDDYLTENAVERILDYWYGIQDKEDFIGVVGLKGFADKNVIGTLYGNSTYLDCTAIELRHKYKVKGDKAEVFETNKLKNYKFPEFKDVKFIPESIIWYKIANDGFKMRHFNEIIYIAEYRNDGLTKNGFKIYLDNWKSNCYCNNCFLTYKKLPIKKRIWAIIDYYRYGFYGKVNILRLFKNCNDRKLSIVGIPLGFLKLVYTYSKIVIKFSIF